MKITIKFIALISITTWATSSFCQVSSSPLPTHRVNLSASASVQVAQDLLTMSLTTLREGADPQAVQQQLKAALDSALTLAKREARTGQMDVRTGRFGLSPRFGRDGKMTGWQGTAELVLEGRDFVRISETAGKLQSLTVASAHFGLSREQTQTAQLQAQSQAIAQFRQNATEVAKGFGFEGYTLSEVSLSADDNGAVNRPRLMVANAMAADAAVPMEAGQTSVTVTVAGSVQLK